MHWYVVASQKEVRIFVKTIERQKLKLLKTLTNSLGREKKRFLIRKQAGRGVRSTGHLGSVHFSYPKRHDPHEEAVIQFTKEVVQFLNKEMLKRSFNSLSIIAEPHLLGKLKAEMKKNLKVAVTQWIGKDLQKTPKLRLNEMLVNEQTNSVEPLRKHRDNSAYLTEAKK